MPGPTAIRASFQGSSGAELAARLDMPQGPTRAFALFAHCFTCSKDILAAKRISEGLARNGVAVLRFDFTGLGSSQGEFANTNFSSNVADLILAADYLRQNFKAPAILVGHSLGGSAVLAAAHAIPEAKAVVTIGSPSDVGHILGQFASSVDQIRTEGQAEVRLGGRAFKIRKSFIDDAEGFKLAERIGSLGKALLVMHAPRDASVGIDNATKIFAAAKHPKSFVSLDDADHLLTGAAQATYAAGVIAAWAAKYIPEAEPADVQSDHVAVRESGAGKFQNLVTSGRHQLLADEPVDAGGLDTGPNPYDFLSIALGACTSMTLRVYAEHKKLALGRVSVDVRHGKVAAEHCSDCDGVAAGRTGKIDRFERIISVEGAIDDSLKAKVLEIADKCPVHRTLTASSAVVTRLASPLDAAARES